MKKMLSAKAIFSTKVEGKVKKKCRLKTYGAWEDHKNKRIASMKDEQLMLRRELESKQPWKKKVWNKCNRA